MSQNICDGTGLERQQAVGSGSGRLGGGRVLLLAEESAWAGPVRDAAARAGGLRVDTAHSGHEAMGRLVDPRAAFSHLLLEPAAAGEHLRDLVGLTAGEPGAQTQLVWLGYTPGAPPRASVASSAADLFARLTQRDGMLERPALASREFAAAMAERRIVNHYQPIVSYADSSLVALEALARWEHSVHGTLPPDAFIALAERAGLAGFLTEDVTIRALLDIARLPPGTLRPSIGINFPLDVLLMPESLSRLDAARQVAGIAAERVIVELTESRPVRDVRSLHHAAERLRHAGYQLVVDDVGPSVADHRALFQLPFSGMKLDKDLVRQSASRADARRFVERAIADGKARGLTVVAEGVETPELWQMMRDAGADMAQGFLIGRALPMGALPAWAESWRLASSPPA